MPMRIYPAIHYTMGGLWVDYNLMSTIPGPARARRGELLRPRRQPARRERADAGAGRRLLRHPVHARRTTSAARRLPAVTTDHDAFKRGRGVGAGAASTGCSSVKGIEDAARSCTASSARCSGTTSAWRATTPACARRSRGFRSCARSSGRTSRCRAEPNNLNKNLEYAGRVADYLEFAELLALDALHRTESCGGHFREESQTPDGEALRDDENFSLRRGVGVPGRRQAADAAQGAADVRVREADAAELQVSCQLQLQLPAEAGAGSWQLEAEAGAYAHHLKVWRQAGPTSRAVRRLRRRRRLARHVLPRDARRRQRRADREGRGSDRVRLGLPRGHLRRVRVPGQRRAARAGPGHDRLPAAHAALQGRRPADARAVARQGLSRSSRTSSSIAARSTGSSRPAATRRSTSAARRTPTRS